jgi:hypothetical protein
MNDTSRDAAPDEKHVEKPVFSKAYIFYILFCIAGIAYFDIVTRWKITGSWNCEQQGNGYPTVETFGFFGQRETDNNAGCKSLWSIFAFG